jgi:hypothetical protein
MKDKKHKSGVETRMINNGHPCGKEATMRECQLLATCPYVFIDRPPWSPKVTEADKETYCNGQYAWCGRYMVFRVVEWERQRRKLT